MGRNPTRKRDHRSGDKSRMRRESHVRFHEGLGVKCPRATRLPIRFWLYFLRVAVAKAVHRRRFGYPDRPDRPTAAHRIRYAFGELARTA
jgi:hypothetical protein